MKCEIVINYALFLHEFRIIIPSYNHVYQLRKNPKILNKKTLFFILVAKGQFSKACMKDLFDRIKHVFKRKPRGVLLIEVKIRF